MSITRRAKRTGRSSNSSWSEASVVVDRWIDKVKRERARRACRRRPWRRALSVDHQGGTGPSRGARVHRKLATRKRTNSRRARCVLSNPFLRPAHLLDDGLCDRAAGRDAADVARAARRTDARHRPRPRPPWPRLRATARVAAASRPTGSRRAGLAISWPAMSGADPCTGSNRPVPSPRLADGRRPSDPAIAPGFIRQDVAEHVFRQDHVERRGRERQRASRTSRHTCGPRGRPDNPSRRGSTTSRHSRDVSSTLALSTEVTWRLRSRAASNATRAIRSTSPRE